MINDLKPIGETESGATVFVNLKTGDVATYLTHEGMSK